MNIVNSYIIEQPKLTAPSAGTALVNATDKQQNAQKAQDSYRKNAAAAEVIEAEYVDYRPNSTPITQEQHDISRTLNAEIFSTPQPIETVPTTNNSVSKYKMTPTDLPLPGTYINTFA